MTVETAVPAFFECEGTTLFGWIHRTTAISSLGLVICNPFGYEAICAHRSLRRVASRAAAAGIPAIRFDYLNTGDSDDVDAGENLIKHWVRNIHAAADVLREQTGVDKIVFLGLRLGATLAALASFDRQDLVGYIGIEPVIAGRTYLREMRALQSAFGATSTEFQDADTVHEVLGFPLSEASKEALNGIDLRMLSAALATEVLVFSRDGIKDSRLWIEKLRAAGTNVARLQASGYVEMMQDPHKAVVPAAMIDQAIDWIQKLARASQHATSSRQTTGQTLPASIGTTMFGAVQEQALWVEGADRLFSIITEPGAASSPRTGRLSILLINAGATHHVGPNRMYVSWARTWAAAGHTVMRTDLSGIGDSEARSAGQENIVYPKHACDNVMSALSYLRRRQPHAALLAVGLCSGAFHALQAAGQPGSIDGIVMINPLTYFWNYETGTGIGDLETSKRATQRSHVSSARRVSLAMILNRARLQRVGKHLIIRALQRAGVAAREFCRALGIQVKNDLFGVLRGIIARRVDIQLIFSAGDPGLDLLALQGGPRVAKLIRTKCIGLLQIQGADHTMTLMRKQRELTDAIARHIETFSQARTSDQ